MPLNMLITFCDLPLTEIVAVHFLLQAEQQFSAPVPCQTCNDFLFGGMNTAIAHVRQYFWIPFSIENGSQDLLACLSHDVANNVRQLQVHLRQALLHAVDAV